MPPKKTNRVSKMKASKSKGAKSPSKTTPVPEASSEYIFFWRPKESEHSYLSQWYRSPFTTTEDPSTVFKTAEQYMMYHKALLFNDHEIAEAVLETSEPKDQKSLGAKVRNFDEQMWKANKERIVYEGNYYKFLNGRDEGEGNAGEAPGLKNKLLATGDKKLVEASPYDKIWGIGFHEKGAEAKKSKWGQNLLGLAIERARKTLREEAEEEETEKTEDTAAEDT